MWDMLPEGKKIGGAPANFAYHVSQFGLDSRVVSAVGAYHVSQFGLDSRVVSAVGEDELGAEILKNFREKELKSVP